MAIVLDQREIKSPELNLQIIEKDNFFLHSPLSYAQYVWNLLRWHGFDASVIPHDVGSSSRMLWVHLKCATLGSIVEE